MANQEHVAVVRQGTAAIAQWRREHPKETLNLIVADLSRANLSGANLFGANLFGADLSGANLQGATLRHTSVAATDMSRSTGLSAVNHQAPSSIGVDTLVRSFRGADNRLTPELETFFLGAGVPKELLRALPQILAEVKYCSTFVCYGEPNRAFAEKLVVDLKARGVSCWQYSMDVTPGERTWQEISRKRREMEKMVVLCSVPALVRDGVLKEIEEQIDEDPDKMVPISLDNLWRQKGFSVTRGERNLKPFLEGRNWADFSDASTYEVSLNGLLRGLERSDRKAVRGGRGRKAP